MELTDLGATQPSKPIERKKFSIENTQPSRPIERQRLPQADNLQKDPLDTLTLELLKTESKIVDEKGRTPPLVQQGEDDAMFNLEQNLLRKEKEYQEYVSNLPFFQRLSWKWYEWKADLQADLARYS